MTPVPPHRCRRASAGHPGECGWRSARSPSGAAEQAHDRSGPGGLPAQVELEVDVLQVPLDGADAQSETLCDLVVVLPLGREVQDLQLAGGQRLQANLGRYAVAAG